MVRADWSATVPSAAIVSVGALEFGAGTDAVLHAMTLLRTEHPDLRYVVAGRARGDAGGRYRECLLALAHDLGIADRVLVLDRDLDPDRTATALHASAALVVPTTRLGPAHHTAIRTALRLGRPVVLARRALVDGVAPTARIVLTEPDHDESLADAIHVALDPCAQPVLCAGVRNGVAVGRARP